MHDLNSYEYQYFNNDRKTNVVFFPMQYYIIDGFLKCVAFVVGVLNHPQVQLLSRRFNTQFLLYVLKYGVMKFFNEKKFTG